MRGVDIAKLRESTYNVLSYCFDTGAVYYLTTKSGELQCVIPMEFGKSEILDVNLNYSGVIPIIHSVFSIKDTANMTSAVCQALDYILSSLVKKFESPIFFACRNIHHTITSVATDCFLIDSMNYGISADDENDNMPWLIPYVLGKWSKTDTSNLVDDLIGCVERSDEDSKFYAEGNLFPYSLYRVSDFEQFKHELSRFSRMVAERFNLATKGVDLKPHVSSSAPVTDTEVFEEMTLNVSDIKLPDTIKGDVAIPSFVKKQVKQNCLKHIRIYDDNVVSKEDAPIVIYLRSLGVKTVLCKKKKVLEQVD